MSIPEPKGMKTVLPSEARVNPTESVMSMDVCLSFWAVMSPELLSAKLLFIIDCKPVLLYFVT